MAKKYCYLFSEGNADMRELLGGKGANLAEMTGMGLPVPQGFTISTEACTQYYEDGRKINEGIMAEINEYITKMEEITGKKFGDKVIENSAQTFADNINEFSGMIGERQVGCPLVVHRRCIEPMFSISNMISYDNRMFNKTHKKEDYLKQEQPFLIKKSGWINVEGTENGSKDHFVKNQAERVCQLLENALHIYTNLYETDDKIFIITPFRTVAESMRKFVIGYFSVKGYDKEMLTKWTKNCVGTVHTFQGKDANEVLFVLGCSDKSVGAMNWVVKKANILNVACTRAKYRIAFIGNLNDWKNRRYFREFIPKFIDTIDA